MLSTTFPGIIVDNIESLPRDEAGGESIEVGYLSTSMGLLARDLYRAINRAIDERVALFGLAAHTCRYLAIMRDQDGVTPSYLSDYLSVRSPTTLAALRTLEEKGLVRRARDSQDGRKSLYRLTARGEQVESLVRKSAIEVERLAVSALSPLQVVQFREAVGLIRGALDANLGEGAR